MRHFSSLVCLFCFAGFQALYAQHIQVQPAAAGSSQFLSPGSSTPVIEVTSAGGLVLRANVGEAINLQETGGTNVLTITSAGKLRVGTAGTGYFLPQTGGTSGQVLAWPGAGNDLVWQNPSVADNLGNHTATENLNLGAFTLVGNGGSSGITITATGKVGIGTASPNAQLQLANSAASRMLVLFDQNNNDHQFYGFGINGTSIRYQVESAASDHVFFSGSSASSSLEIMRIKGGGNVGIGINNPSERLEVSGNGKFSGSLAAGSSISASGNLSITGSSTLTGALSVVGNATFTGAVNTFNSGGNAFSMPTTRGGAGTVLGSDGSSGLVWITPYTLPGGAAGGVAYYDATGTNLQNNASFFKWDNTNKRLGVGVTAPSEALEVGGNVKASGTLNIGGASTLTGTVTLNAGANAFSLPTTAGTAGQLMMSNATTTGWTSGLTWDNTNSRLGFNTNTPLANLHVKQKTAADNAATLYETTANASYSSAGVKNSTTSALLVSNATSSGSVSWTSLASISLSDNSYATVTTSGAQQSHRIQPLSFFNPVANNVPTGATITGIMVYVERKASVGNSVKDFAVQLLKAGVTVGTTKSLDEYWTTSDATVVYGSPTDTWGTTWTVTDINAINTGLDFSVTTQGVATASIDQIRMVVYYTLSNASGSAVVWSAGVADGTNKFTVAQDNTIGADQDVFAINPKGDVEIYGNYTYAFPQSRTLTINNAAFTLYSTNVAYDITRQFSSYPIYAYMTGGTQSSLGQMVASVSIPDGATITSVSARLADDIAGLTTKVELVRCGDASGTVLASCQLATDQASATLVTEYLNHVVDNDLYSYALVFHGSQGAGTATGFKSLLYNVKITYLTTRAD